MKNPLAVCWAGLKRYWKDILLAGAYLALLLIAFIAGAFMFYLETADMRLWESIAVTPEPEHCALCGYGDRVRYQGPALINLATGEIGELKIYDTGPEYSYEISEHQSDGVGAFGERAGVPFNMDTFSRSGEAELPRRLEDMDPSHFCRDCRVLLSEHALEGFVLLDLYEAEAITAYTIEADAEYTFRDYTVRIDEDKGKLVIHVQGHLKI